MKKHSSHIAPYWFCVHILLFICISYFAFLKNIGWLFPGGDGAYPISLFKSQIIWNNTFLGLPWNPLQGLGDIDFPLSTWLVPAFVIPSFFLGIDNIGSQDFQIFSYIIFSLELFLSSLLLTKSLGFTRFESYTSAWLTPIFLLPYFGVPLLYPLFLFSPQASTIVAALLLTMTLLLFLTQQSPLRYKSFDFDLIFSVLLIILLSYICLLGPATVILIFPTYGFIGIVIILTSERSLRLNLLGWFILVIGFIILLYFLVFIYGVFGFTASGMAGSKLEIIAALKDWSVVSNWFYSPAKLGKYLIPFAALGLFFGFFFCNGRKKIYSACILGLMAAIFICGFLVVQTNYWKFPSLIYYEIFLVPLYSLAAVYGFFQISISILSLIKIRCYGLTLLSSYSVPWMLFFSLIVPLTVLINAIEVKNSARVYGPLPPLDSPIIKILKEEIQLQPNKPFRGRVVTMLKISEKKSISWMDLVLPTQHLVETRGNDHYWSGLWPNQIPTLFKYSPLISPSFFLTVTSLLGESADHQMRNVVVLRKPVPDVLALLGVKYVITDSVLDQSFKLIYLDKVDDEFSVFLYEVPNVNIGSVSPLFSVIASTFQNAITHMAQLGFDSKREFLLFEELPKEFRGDLSNALDSSIIVKREGLHVQAKSTGNSVLILPFEFSRCWKAISNINGFPPPILFRANATLLGVGFKGELDATLSYSAGLFHNVGCRIQDKSDFKRIQ